MNWVPLVGVPTETFLRLLANGPAGIEGCPSQFQKTTLEKETPHLPEVGGIIGG